MEIGQASIDKMARAVAKSPIIAKPEKAVHSKPSRTTRQAIERGLTTNAWARRVCLADFHPNGQQALDLSGAVLLYDHEHGQRLAQFEPLKRDGAVLEPMGAAPSRFSYALVLMGTAPLTAGGAPMSAGARYQALVEAQRSQPKGCWSIPGLVAGKSGGGHCRRVRSHSGRSIRSSYVLSSSRTRSIKGLRLRRSPRRSCEQIKLSTLMGSWWRHRWRALVAAHRRSCAVFRRQHRTWAG